MGGLSFVEANASGRIVRYSLSRDVIEARSRIERDFPNLRIWWDNENQEHVIVERDKHGDETLVLATPMFHEAMIREYLYLHDNSKFDPLDEVDKHNAAVEAEQDRRFSERMGEIGEKLAHAFAADGLTVRPRMAPLSIPLKKRKILSNYEIPNR